MVIEIKRSMVLREPWTTNAAGGTNRTFPLVATMRAETPGGHELANQIAATINPINTFRVVDGIGPCYEFEGTAALSDDVLTVRVEGALRFLR